MRTLAIKQGGHMKSIAIRLSIAIITTLSFTPSIVNAGPLDYVYNYFSYNESYTSQGTLQVISDIKACDSATAQKIPAGTLFKVKLKNKDGKYWIIDIYDAPGAEQFNKGLYKLCFNNAQGKC